MCTGPHPFIPAPDTLRVEAHYRIFGQQVENITYYAGPAVLTGDFLNAFATAWFDLWSANLAPLQTSDLELTDIVLIDMSDATGVRYTWVPDAAAPGTDTNPPLPLNVTAAITFHTARRGRGSQGRNYHIGMTKPKAEQNLINEAYRASLQAAYSNFTNIPIDSDNHAQVVLSQCQDGAWLTTANTWNVLSVSVDNLLDSQRRRLTGRGR